MKVIDLNKPLGVRLNGITHGRMLTIVTTKANIDKSNKSEADVCRMLDKYLDTFSNAINEAYRDGKDGYIQLGNTSANIQDWAALQIVFVQDGEEVEIPTPEDTDWED